MFFPFKERVEFPIHSGPERYTQVALCNIKEKFPNLSGLII